MPDRLRGNFMNKKSVGETVYIKATVTAVNPDGTARTVAIDHAPDGGIYLYAIDSDQSTAAVID